VQATPGGLRQPDLTLWFDLEPALAAQRVAQARERDRFEQQDLAFFERVRGAYLARRDADPSRFARIDASRTREQVAEQIDAVLQERGW
jgi:dTMP kinase